MSRFAGVMVALAAVTAATASADHVAAQASCGKEALAVQVLGSGGPHAGGARASSGYLIWRDGRAVVMVDAGGGTFVRFGEAGARLQDLSLLAISHLHPDHVADLPALLWQGEQARRQPLKVVGPTGTAAFPAITTFFTRLFATGTGAFPFMAGTLGEAGQGARTDVTAADATVGSSSQVWADGDLEVTAIGVPHANVPSLAYRVRVGERTIVFGSDQNGSDDRFSAFAADADLLVMHLALSEGAAGPVSQVHARPSVVGRVAQAAKARRLVLSHFMQAPPAMPTPGWFSLSDLEAAAGEVRKVFTGPVETASDLQCFPIR